MDGVVASFANAEGEQPQAHQHTGSKLYRRGSDSEQHAGRPYEVPPLLQIQCAPDLHKRFTKRERRTPGAAPP